MKVIFYLCVFDCKGQFTYRPLNENSINNRQVTVLRSFASSYTKPNIIQICQQLKDAGPTVSAGLRITSLLHPWAPLCQSSHTYPHHCLWHHSQLLVNFLCLLYSLSLLTKTYYEKNCTMLKEIFSS